MKKLFLLLIGVLAITATLFIHKPRQTVPASPSAQTVSVATMRVGDKTYSVNVTPNETVTGAMRALSLTDDFTYTSREYPGLGKFIDSINGKKNAGGMYWILYMNGVSATSGASAAVINTGDVIEWKYEKGY